MATQLEILAAHAVAQAGGPHSCELIGHEWEPAGGANASCGAPNCQCSIPVKECRICGNCDYGDNEEARVVRERCARFGPAT